MKTASLVLYKTDRAELETVLACLAGVQKIYLVDNSPTDELRDFERPGVEYIWGHGNVGYGAGHNIAIRKARELGAQYHVVLNSDVYFGPDVLPVLEKYMEANLDVGQAMPQVRYPNGELQYLCKMIPSPMIMIFRRFLPKSFTAGLMERFQLKFTGYSREMNVPYLSGCFMYLRMDALEKVGLFDERFFMYPEDIDLTRRIHEQYRTMFNPAVEIVHAHAAESRTSARMLWVHISNMILYYNKWGWVFDAKRRKYNKQLIESLKVR